jgi:hypothetical protein
MEVAVLWKSINEEDIIQICKTILRSKGSQNKERRKDL